MNGPIKQSYQELRISRRMLLTSTAVALATMVSGCGIVPQEPGANPNEDDIPSAPLDWYMNRYCFCYI